MRSRTRDAVARRCSIHTAKPISSTGTPTPGAKPWRKHVAKHIGESPAPRKNQADSKDDARNRKGKGE